MNRNRNVPVIKIGEYIMYKLLVVEDEKLISQGIAHSIPWNEWGFVVTGICCNGLEALEFLEKDKPDLVLTDIRMPKMDGIALMQYLREHYPEIKIIILSGYTDFEYLQISIRSHVAEYLLKPTDLDEFQALFARMKEVLDQEGKEQQNLEAMQMDQRYNALLKGYGYEDEADLKELLSDGPGRYGVILLAIDQGAAEDKSLLYQQKKTITDLLGQQEDSGISGYYWCNYEDEITGLLCVGEDREESEISTYIKALLEKVRKELGLVISCGISSFYEDYHMLPKCYEQTKCSISQRIFCEESEKLFFFHKVMEASFDYYQLSFDEDRILKALLNGQEKELEQEVTGIFEGFRNRIISDYESVNRMTTEILINISRKVLRYGMQPEKIMNEHGYSYSDLHASQTLDEKQAFLMGILSLFMKECHAQHANYSKTSELAYLIREIVDEEYDSNLMSLEYLAEKVHKNAAYISKIYKSEFNCNFSAYVTEKRLEKSRKLLADPLIKIYEISQQIGWMDVSNFIKVFKKKYGMSPDEYRKLLSRKGQMEG